MTDLEATMREWLADPDPVKREHAARRIAMGFDLPANYERPPAQPIIRHPFQRRSVIAHYITCPYLDRNCGCDVPTCHAGLGDYDGGTHSSRDNCLKCLGYLE